MAMLLGLSSVLKENNFAENSDNNKSILTKASTSTSFTEHNKENSILSMSLETSMNKTLAPYFDLLHQYQICDEASKAGSLQLKPEEVKIIYNNRNILDLAENVEWKNDIKPAKIQAGARFFLENRSQYSRVMEYQTPDPIMMPCPVQECAFKEPHYN